jgi:hypothetical protein
MISVDALSLAFSPHHRRPSSLGLSLLPPPEALLLPHHWAAASTCAQPMKNKVASARNTFIRILL